MDEELERLFAALQAADTEWREHRQAGWQAYHVGETSGLPQSNPFTREWRERDEELRARFDAARTAWMNHLPVI